MVSASVGVLGKINAEVTVAGVLATVTVPEVMGVPEPSESTGVASH